MIHRRLPLIVLAALCLSAAPALADLAVVVSPGETVMTIAPNSDATVTGLTIAAESSAAGGSPLQVKIQDTASLANVDAVELLGYDMLVELTLMGSGNNYTATGTFKLWDRVGDTSTTPDIYADFESSNVTYSFIPAGLPNYGLATLAIQGPLYTVAGNASILLPSSDPWTFQGDGPVAGIAADEDGVANTVSVAKHVIDYDVGGLVTFEFPTFTTYTTLQSLLLHETVLDNGDVQATVVPAPAALLLGALGMGVAGLRLRKPA